MRLNKISLAALALGGCMLLSACGGGNDSPLRPTSVANGDVSATITKDALPKSQAAVQSIVGQIFDFPSGIPSLGIPSGDAKVKLLGSGVAPTFEIESGGFKASGPMSYGSCIFTVDSSSTFVAPHLLAYVPPTVPPAAIDPNRHIVSPCSVTVDTSGKVADGSQIPTQVSFNLAGAISFVTVNVSIDPVTHIVTVNGSDFGTATVVVTTGAGN